MYLTAKSSLLAPQCSAPANLTMLVTSQATLIRSANPTESEPAYPMEEAYPTEEASVLRAESALLGRLD